MTPEAAKLLIAEAAVWKSRTGRRAMKLLELSLYGRWSLGLEGDTFAQVEPGPLRGRVVHPLPDALAVAFLTQQARAALDDGVIVFVDSTGAWGAFHPIARGGRAFLSAAGQWGDGNTANEFPTESHALIAALLAGSKKR